MPLVKTQQKYIECICWWIFQWQTELKHQGKGVADKVSSQRQWSSWNWISLFLMITLCSAVCFSVWRQKMILEFCFDCTSLQISCFHWGEKDLVNTVTLQTVVLLSTNSYCTRWTKIESGWVKWTLKAEERLRPQRWKFEEKFHKNCISPAVVMKSKPEGPAWADPWLWLAAKKGWAGTRPGLCQEATLCPNSNLFILHLVQNIISPQISLVLNCSWNCFKNSSYLKKACNWPVLESFQNCSWNSHMTVLETVMCETVMWLFLAQLWSMMLSHVQNKPNMAFCTK